MGCGGSKQPGQAKKPTTSDKPMQPPKGSKNSPARRSLVPKHGQDERTRNRSRRPPKGLRRPSNTSQKMPEVPMEARYSSPIPYEAENLALEGNWELEKGIDVSFFFPIRT